MRNSGSEDEQERLPPLVDRSAIEFTSDGDDLEGHAISGDVLVDVEGHALSVRLPQASDAAALRTRPRSRSRNGDDRGRWRHRGTPGRQVPTCDDREQAPRA